MNESKQVRAIVVDRAASSSLAIRDVPFAARKEGEVTVRVTAISLNQGEVKRALTSAESGTRPGWDFVGIVEDSGTENEAPAENTRVVGLLHSGSWAERLHVPIDFLAPVPAGVSDSEAVCLPVTGLTALHTLRKGGSLLGRKVLIEGANGGVGHLAVQLASLSGAHVVGQIRNEAHRPMIEKWCSDVIVDEDLEAARSSGPFHLILDSLGGSALSTAVTMLRKDGTCVTFGATAGDEVRFEGSSFFRAPGAKMEGLVLFDDLAKTETASEGLTTLLRLVDEKALRPHVAVEEDWENISDVAQGLLDRKFSGKAVLHLRA